MNSFRHLMRTIPPSHVGILLFVLLYSPVQASIGKIGTASGEVFVNGKPTKAGALLSENDQVETKDGRAIVVIGAASIMHLNPDSKITVGAHTKSGTSETGSIALEQGSVRGLVAKERNMTKVFHVKTRSAVMGVRGTHFVVESPVDARQKDSFLVVEGRGELSFRPPPGAPGSGGPGGGSQGEGKSGGPGGGNSGGGGGGESRGPAQSGKADVVLKDRQSCSAGGSAPTGREPASGPPVQTLSAGAVGQVVESVGIPQAPMMTPGEMRGGPPPTGPSLTNNVGPNLGGPTPQMPEPPRIIFDPVLNGGTTGNKTLSVRLTR